MTPCAGPGGSGPLADADGTNGGLVFRGGVDGVDAHGHFLEFHVAVDRRKRRVGGVGAQEAAS